MKKAAFICVHNSCRSQIAEALGKKLAGDVFESYSAGTETKPQINQDAVRLMKQVHGIDMEKTQHSKLHHVFIHLIAHTFSGILTPLDTAQGIVVGHKAAVVAGNLGVDGKNLDDAAAPGADLLVERRCPGLALTAFHSGHDAPSLSLYQSLVVATRVII